VLLAGAVGFGAWWRRLRKRSSADAFHSGPAAQLREKLALSRAAAVAPSTEVPAGEAAAPLDPASRRRAIHDRARGAIDELG
jgi:hypothetical protein